MNIKTLILSAAAVVAISSATPAMALDSHDLANFSCKTDGLKTVCVPQMTKKERDKHFATAILPVLRKHNYPGSIVVENPAMLSVIKAGWGKRADCEKLPVKAVTGDPRVDLAKVLYCMIRNAGYPMEKPKITLASK